MNSFLSLFDEKSMPLIMSLPANEPALAQAAFEAGADAVKVHINVRHFASGAAFSSLADERAALESMLARASGPMGIVLGDTASAAARDLDGACTLPFSFVSAYAKHAPARLLDKRIARMIACGADDSADDAALLAQTGADVLEASVVPREEYGQPLTLCDLAVYRALCGAVGIPVVVPSQKALVPEDVRRLRDVGVRGVMIGAVVTGNTEAGIREAVAAFRRAADAL